LSQGKTSEIVSVPTIVPAAFVSATVLPFSSVLASAAVTGSERGIVHA
jgi:hypothetical protein